MDVPNNTISAEDNEYLREYAKEMQQEYDGWDNNWTIHSLIGVGSQGKVFKLINKNNPTYPFTALKVITISNSIILKKAKEMGYVKTSIQKNIKSVLSEFVPELKLLNEIQNFECVPKIYNIKTLRSKDNSGWNVFIHMELLTRLEDFFSNKQITEKDIYKLSLDISRALIDCQESNIIHGDIKPSNIFVDKQGVFKLGDFGTAFKISSDKKRLRIGTLPFMAPEVISNYEYSFSSDIYSLGITLYVLLNNNRFPFILKDKQTNEDIIEVMKKHVDGPAFSKPSCASEGFGSVILKACSINKPERYSNAKELLLDLNSIKDLIGDSVISTGNSLYDSSLAQTIITCKDPFNESRVYKSENKERTYSYLDSDTFNTHIQRSIISDTNKHTERLSIRLINWIFTCIFAGLPIFIFIFITSIFNEKFSIISKIATELLYFGLSVSIINIRELVSSGLIKKRNTVYLLALFIMLSVIIFCSISFGIMTMNELGILEDSITETSILWVSIVLSSVSFITGTALQIWEGV